MTAPDTASTDPLSDARNQFRQGVIACLPTILGYWSIGFASGAIGAVAGFSVLEITLLSGLLYTGSAQFLFVDHASLLAADDLLALAWTSGKGDQVRLTD